MTKSELRESLTPLFRILDILLSPFTLMASLLFFSIRKMRVAKMPLSKMIFKKVGVFPILDHYYEPLFNDAHLRFPLDKDRNLPGIGWNEAGQLALLNDFHYQEELDAIPFDRPADELQFFYGNPSLGPGDAEYLYCMIRHFKPGKIVEIGSGYSTLIARQAIATNRSADAGYQCAHICIEPYEMPWLEKTGVEVHRKLVEEVDLSLFRSLGKNDILFIDSSHMIRPQGDVLFEFLQILPSLQSGVVIHVHDIFSPKDYTRRLLVEDVLFWNEQYLLEAFLTCNDQFRIIGALNYLKSHHPEEMYSRLPLLRKIPSHVPASFWMAKN
ncbi:MAG TPA: class I SAM-dependent methyltransferase [Puia sp.]|nr:class I SAM-dependent methyltransferase [Puia sp.]